MPKTTTEYDQGFADGVVHAIDTFVPPDTSNRKTQMSRKYKKATRAPRKPRKPRADFMALATSTNAAMQQIANEFDGIRRVISAIVAATGSEAKVLELLGRTPATDAPPAADAEPTAAQ